MRQPVRPRPIAVKGLAAALAVVSLAGAAAGCQARRYSDADPNAGRKEAGDAGTMAVRDEDTKNVLGKASEITKRGGAELDAMPMCESALSKARFDPALALRTPTHENLAYFSAISILAYKKPDGIERMSRALGFTEVEAVVDPTTATEALILDRPDFMVVTFAGTASAWEVLTDIDLSFDKSLFGAGVHKGFLRSYRGKGTQFKGIRVSLIEAVKRRGWPAKKMYVTGHSLGGALATLFAADLTLLKRYQGGDPSTPMTLPSSCSALGGSGAGNDAVDGVVTFGITRIGDARFAECYNAILKPQTWRVVYDLDLFPLMASRNFYQHVGQRVHLSREGKIEHEPSDSEEPGQGFARFVRQLFAGGIVRDVVDHLSYAQKAGHFLDPMCPKSHPASQRLGLK